MKIVISGRNTITIDQFAELHDLTVVIRERDAGHWGCRNCMRFYAEFENCEVKDGPMLVSAFGNGATYEEAIADYKQEISGKRLVFDAYSDDRKEIYVPVLA